MESRLSILVTFLVFVMFASCEQPREHTAPAIHERDSVSMMTTYGVNTLISDSGVIKYRIVTERWDVNTIKQPSRWTFERGIFLEQFDDKFHIEGYIFADTAWYYDQIKLWGSVAGCAFVMSTDWYSEVRNCFGMVSNMSFIHISILVLLLQNVS